MKTRKKFGIMVVASFWSAVIMALVLSIVSQFRPIPSYTIPWFNLTLSRWWDILFLPVYINIILGFFLFLIPYLRDKYKIGKSDLATGLMFGVMFGLMFGLTAGLAAELTTVGLTVGLAAGLTIALVFGLMFRLVFGLTAGLAVGLMFGLMFGLVFGLAAGLAAGLMFGLMFGLVFGLVFALAVGVFWPIKKIVNFHKWLLRD